MFLSSAEERARKKVQFQHSHIRRLEFERAKRIVQDRFLSDDMVVENMKSIDTDKIKMVVTVKVDKLSVTLAATADDAANGSIWSQTVTPQKSIKLEMNDFSLKFESKNSNSDILQARLHEITVRHFSKDSSGQESELFDILAPGKYTVGWLFLLETAKNLEKLYREFDQDGDAKLNLAEIKALLMSKNIRLQDSQLQKFKEQVDTDGDGIISLEEFVQLALVLCSRSEMKIKLPIPSTISNLDQNTTFITCKVEKNPSMNFTEVSVGRLQLQVATFPLRNAMDWMNLVTGANRKTENIKDASKSFDEVAAAIEQKQVAKPGLKVLRASFEGNLEDIFIPPKNSSELRFEMKEIDVVLHDMLMGEAALFFRAGPLSLSMSSMLPCEDGHPYVNKMKIALNRLRLLYARRKFDMDWDLENILSETKCVFNCNQTMARDLSGRTQDDAIQIEGVCDDEMCGSSQGQKSEPTVPDKEIFLQLSLNQVLFIQGMQKVFEKALQENNVHTAPALKRDQSYMRPLILQDFDLIGNKEEVDNLQKVCHSMPWFDASENDKLLFEPLFQNPDGSDNELEKKFKRILARYSKKTRSDVLAVSEVTIERRRFLSRQSPVNTESERPKWYCFCYPCFVDQTETNQLLKALQNSGFIYFNKERQICAIKTFMKSSSKPAKEFFLQFKLSNPLSAQAKQMLESEKNPHVGYDTGRLRSCRSPSVCVCVCARARSCVCVCACVCALAKPASLKHTCMYAYTYIDGVKERVT
jgi:hypothetical protein